MLIETGTMKIVIGVCSVLVVAGILAYLVLSRSALLPDSGSSDCQSPVSQQFTLQPGAQVQPDIQGNKDGAIEAAIMTDRGEVQVAINDGQGTDSCHQWISEGVFRCEYLRGLGNASLYVINPNGFPVTVTVRQCFEKGTR